MGEKLSFDERGRITIPASLRDKYGFKSGDEVELIEKNGEILLKPIRNTIRRIKTDRKWGKDAFLRAGEATFEG